MLQDLKAAEDAEQAAGEVAADPHALERRKLAEAEEWRMQQLRTGQAADNANFQVRRQPTRAGSRCILLTRGLTSKCVSQWVCSDGAAWVLGLGIDNCSSSPASVILTHP
jgi:hypothetical protein